MKQMRLVLQWLQGWLAQPSGLVLLGGGSAVVLSLVVMVMLAIGQWQGEWRSRQSRAVFLARVLEDQATRTIESSQLALNALAESAALRGGQAKMASVQGPWVMGPVLQQALFSMSSLRALAVVDGQGRVLASTQAAEIGMHLDLARMTPAVGPSRGAQLGPLIQGRGLAAVQRQPVAQEAVASGAGTFLPLLRGFTTDAGEARTLVGLLSPEAFASFQHLAMESEDFESVIASYQGVVLATSGGRVVDWAGKQVDGVPVFARLVPARESGEYVGQGVAGSQQLVAFRASATQPIVAVVEQSQQHFFWQWVRAMRGPALVGMALVALIAVLTFATWRGVRQKESARMEADLAQLRVSRSQRDLSMLMRSVQELIFWADREGVITYVNARWTEFSGLPMGRALGMRLQDIVHPDSHLGLSQALDPESTQGVRHCPALVRMPDGRERHFDAAIVPLRTDGRVQGFVGSAVDVTDRWQAEQRLQEQIAFQRILLETSPMPIAVSSKAGVLVQVNKAWEEYKGLKRDDVVGRDMPAFLPPDEARMHQGADAQLLRQGGTTQVEHPVLHGDGHRRDTRLVKAALTDDYGNISGVLTILMDVSEFRAAEQAKEEARQIAEDASRAKSEFVANMSHELRTPLQSILGFAELGVLRSRDHPKLGGMFEDIHSAGNRMLTLVNDLLEVSKLESTVGTFHMERLDLRGVVRPVARELEPLLAQKHVQLRMQMSQSPLMAQADPLRFQQVVRNVLANAIRFSPMGGHIVFSGTIDSQAQVHLVVRDEGPGIPEAELESIFEAFVQSSKTKDGSGGTGLGLAICKTIVEAMGGRIYARNRSSGGAAFHIVLPARGANETQPAELEDSLMG